MHRRFCLALVLVSLTALGATPSAFALRLHASRHAVRRSHVRLEQVERWSPVLRGSHESLLRQNNEIDRLQLDRIYDDQQLETLELNGELVGLHSSRALQIATNLESNRRFCRPWTRAFLEDMSAAYYAEFHQPLEVTSAVRTVEQQARLQRTNHNAAPIEGDTASSHLAGLTVDIAKGTMSGRERHWVDQYVLHLQQLGLVEAAEEHRQACYHIMVSERYTDYRLDPQNYTANR